MGMTGIEPVTPAMSMRYSNQLSYMPVTVLKRDENYIRRKLQMLRLDGFLFENLHPALGAVHEALDIGS